ncbi:SigB/SigF/SigG family RNA polymerase sigma factor [Kitasatospora sp. NBC_01250]|uniref:SigB/SigF/SigG family RNA polymerase sigma factor n=1 Tax=unclassified Kitasatospora TaxID=2633591 RepID=UPI002E116F9A|nr:MULTISPECIES: SigB/SigF/SigG family RNA polymerase sigma factor [unclassified Kitasatospora]WSJ64731.1 SigB/SigF/SigG family RNA polymerase sigma factor [Kitasatospora sp. NBC_01302]
MPATVSVEAPTTARIASAPELRSVAAGLGVDLEDPAKVCPADARELSRILFARLRAVAEESAEYSYIRSTLIELNMTLVRFAASRFGHRREPVEDILQVGTVGLIKAIDRFDPSYEVEFSTFAIPTITGEIKRFFRDTTWMVHVPRRLQELRLTLAKASDAMEQVLDRAPTAAELAAHLELTEAEVLEGLTASQAQSARSLDAPASEEDSSTAPALAASLAFEEPAYERLLALEAIKPLIAELPARERRILALRFSADLTQAQIGQELGISQMHVSRLLNRTLSKLRTALTA